MRRLLLWLGIPVCVFTAGFFALATIGAVLRSEWALAVLFAAIAALSVWVGWVTIQRIRSL